MGRTRKVKVGDNVKIITPTGFMENNYADKIGKVTQMVEEGVAMVNFYGTNVRVHVRNLKAQ